jgi:recombination protein RecT
MSEKQKDQNQNDNSQLPAMSVRFVNEVEKQFADEMGNKIQFSDHEKILAQHMFLKVDQALKEFEDRRLSKGQNNKTPYKWKNVNMRNLALEAVYKVSLGLDALMKNHVHPVPYFNGHNKKYDIDLQTGFKGLIYKAMKFAIDPPKDIVAELIHENDHFKPLKSNFERNIESYEFEIENPFDRGKVQGGFGYIMYGDPTKNKLVLVSNKEFDKAKKAAPTKAIWNEWPEKMKLKTVVRRTVDEIDLDPEKTNAKALIREETGHAENEARREIEENANTQVLDIEPEETEEGPAPQPEPEENEVEQEEPEEDPAAKTEKERPGQTEGPDF